MKTVVVESPTKAKTISRYLGRDYHVIASYGHVRNLVHKDGSVLPEDNFAMKWEPESRGNKQLSVIKKAISESDELILATDPDREGEAISWHICEILKNQVKNMKISRITFHEITKSAIQDAIASPKTINMPLVEAYLARCALDYLVGFKLSPLLWRRLPGSRSAGRVQSVALRLIFEREREIETFKAVEYWDVTAKAKADKKKEFFTRLVSLSGKKLGKLDIHSKKEADEVLDKVSGQIYKVSSIEEKDVKRNSAPPFITSTMQQEAARKLGFTARKTMQLAQKLYEGVEVDGQPIGLITYMRTDSTNIADQAISSIREFVEGYFGKEYIPVKPNIYSKKVRNAQEAHEAIRPTDVNIVPEKLAQILDNDMYRLYTLIWKRAVASQMSSAIIKQVTVDIADEKKDVFRASGRSIKFDGFLKLYEESLDDSNEDEESSIIPNLEIGESIKIYDISPAQHFTQAQPRYTEASLVKKMEELGIGRPSTYANIIYVLQDRNYISLKKKRFFLEDLGRFVSLFLLRYFHKYVEYNFTADMEQDLDDISNEKKDRIDVLKSFWEGFSNTISDAEKLKIQDVVSDIEQDMADYIFPVNSNGTCDKKCPECGGVLGLRLGKYGAFIACSNYPECKYTKKIIQNQNNEESDVMNVKEAGIYEPKVLCISKLSGKELFLKKGPYGFYLETEIGGKLKRSAVPKFLNAETLDSEVAEFLIALPIELGKHPEDSEPVSIGIGRFGPYVKHGNKFVSIKDFEEFRELNIDLAINKLNAKKNK